jgi:uncharacterized protein involved in exopolysaccharide biosynthesis
MGDASIGRVVMKGSTPRVAEIANSIVEVYLQQRRARFIAEAVASYGALKQEADRTERELEELGREIQRFRADSGLLLLYEKDRVQMGQWLALQSDVNSLRALIAENEQLLRVLDRQMAGEGAHMQSDRTFADTATKERLTKLEAQLGNARQLFQPGSPEIRDLEEQIANARREVQPGSTPVIVRNSASVATNYETLRARRQAVESTLAGARASLATKQAEYDRMTDTMKRIPQKMQVNHEYERQQVVLESNLKNINEKLSMAAVSMATARSAPPSMRVVEPAGLPDQPVWPSTKLLLAAAALLGIVVGLIGALLLEISFVRVNRYRLLERDTEYRVLGLAPRDERLLEHLYQRGPAPRLANASAD